MSVWKSWTAKQNSTASFKNKYYNLRSLFSIVAIVTPSVSNWGTDKKKRYFTVEVKNCFSNNKLSSDNPYQIPDQVLPKWKIFFIGTLYCSTYFGRLRSKWWIWSIFDMVPRWGGSHSPRPTPHASVEFPVAEYNRTSTNLIDTENRPFAIRTTKA